MSEPLSTEWATVVIRAWFERGALRARVFLDGHATHDASSVVTDSYDELFDVIRTAIERVR